MRGPKVLGKIDLKKAAPPPALPPGRAAAPAPAGGEAAPGTAPAADGAPRRKKGRKVIKKSDMADTMERDFQRHGKRPQKRRAMPGKEQRKTEITVPRASKRVVRISEVVTVADLARTMGVKAGDVLKKLLDMGTMATINQALDHDTAALVAGEFEYQVENVAIDVEQMLETEAATPTDEQQQSVSRAPVVTIMGHVDHGKTKLLDSIRETDVVAGEFGGITQHIGAYQAHVGERDITFIDTPGHEAFTAMRARGAQITDIAVLVVAADDGVMPQTVEALDHARAAGVPVVVAVNKIDKEEADPNRVRTQMVERGLVPSEWGGDTEFVDVSAKTSANLEGLLETVLIVADLAELKGDPTGRARGTVLEAHLDKGRGPVATVLVQKGTLEVGDSLVCGITHCKVRAMVDENGQPVGVAGPAKPAQVLGWNGVPNVGDEFREVDDEREARHIAAEREARVRSAEVVNQRPASLQELLRRQERQEIPELNLVVKADVQGSLGALTDAFLKLPQDEVRVNLVHSGAGAITEHDVDLAKTAAAIVVGFNVRPNANARELAENEGVDIRLYRVIYDAIDDVKAALSGMLKPEERESILGEAEVRQTFRVPKLGVIAGCYLTRGTIRRNSQVRLIRDGVVVYEGRVGSLRRFKDDVAEVREGFECGIGLENFQDVKEGDVIEAFEVEEFARQIS